MILINAQSNRSEKLGFFSKLVPLYPSGAIGALAAYLLSKAHKVKVWDDAIKMLSTSDIKELIRDYEKPYVFGISCVTASIMRGHDVAKAIKETLPDAFVIVGGVHPTVLPEDSLNTNYVDFVIKGEGEVPLDMLYSALKNKENYENIPGLSFKKDGRIIHNPALPGPNADTLPAFPYDLFEKDKDRYDLGFVNGSRGCPYDCIFCSQRSISGRRFTNRSPEKVVDDIDLVVNKYGRNMITFMDENMLMHKARIKKMCELIVERGLNKKAAFQCQVRGDAVNEEVLKDLKSANFITLYVGLETASERLMALLDKQETVRQNIRALELCKKYGFKVSGAFILGLPTETRQERLQCYKMAVKYLDYVRFNNATPYPGTKLYEIAEKENRFNPGKDWENLNACGTLVEGPFSKKRLSYVPLGTTELDLKIDILKYNLFFYFRCKIILSLLDRKSGTSGWFRLPPRWFFKKEGLYLGYIALKVLLNFFGLFVLMSVSGFNHLKENLKKQSQ